MHRFVMIISVDAYELAEPSSTTEFPEVAYKTRWVSSETYNTAVDVDHKGVMTIYLRASSQTDVCVYQDQAQSLAEPSGDLPSTPNMNASRIIGSSSISVVMWVMRARFFTNPHASPSGVSLGHNMPH